MTIQDIIAEVGELSTMAEEEYTEASQHSYCNSVEIIEAWRTIHERLRKLHDELAQPDRGTPPERDRITPDDFTRVNSDVNGNPRYVVHFSKLSTEEEKKMDYNVFKQYEMACKRANRIGGSKYRGKDYGGGIVFQSYSLTNTIAAIERVKGEAK